MKSVRYNRLKSIYSGHIEEVLTRTVLSFAWKKFIYFSDVFHTVLLILFLPIACNIAFLYISMMFVTD